MKQQMYVLPVRCRKCNALFDLWYDLQELGQFEWFLKEQQLCWRCRNLPQKNKMEIEEDDDIFDSIY